MQLQLQIHPCAHDIYSNIYNVNLWRGCIRKPNYSCKFYEGFNFSVLVILFSMGNLYHIQNGGSGISEDFSETLQSLSFPKIKHILKTNVDKFKL